MNPIREITRLGAVVGVALLAACSNVTATTPAPAPPTGDPPTFGAPPTAQGNPAIADGFRGQVSGAATGELQGVAINPVCKTFRNQYSLDNSGADGLAADAPRLRLDLSVDTDDAPGTYSLDQLRGTAPNTPSLAYAEVIAGGAYSTVPQSATLTLIDVPNAPGARLSGRIELVLTIPDKAQTLTVMGEFSGIIAALPCDRR
jgi:hypothetical protein